MHTKVLHYDDKSMNPAEVSPGEVTEIFQVKDLQK